MVPGSDREDGREDAHPLGHLTGELAATRDGHVHEVRREACEQSPTELELHDRTSADAPGRGRGTLVGRKVRANVELELPLDADHEPARLLVRHLEQELGADVELELSLVREPDSASEVEMDREWIEHERAADIEGGDVRGNYLHVPHFEVYGHAESDHGPRLRAVAATPVLARSTVEPVGTVAHVRDRAADRQLDAAVQTVRITTRELHGHDALALRPDTTPAHAALLESLDARAVVRYLQRAVRVGVILLPVAEGLELLEELVETSVDPLDLGEILRRKTGRVDVKRTRNRSCGRTSAALLHFRAQLIELLHQLFEVRRLDHLQALVCGQQIRHLQSQQTVRILARTGTPGSGRLRRDRPRRQGRRRRAEAEALRETVLQVLETARVLRVVQLAALGLELREGRFVAALAERLRRGIRPGVLRDRETIAAKQGDENQKLDIPHGILRVGPRLSGELC